MATNKTPFGKHLSTYGHCSLVWSFIIATILLTNCASTKRYSHQKTQPPIVKKQTPAPKTIVKQKAPASVQASIIPPVVDNLIKIAVPGQPDADPAFEQTGIAAYYSKSLHGRKTASGERYNMREYTAAHRTLPFGSRVKVTNLSNNRSVIVRINDRGPFTKKRIIDLSHRAAEEIGLIQRGVAKVRVTGIPP